VMIILCDSEAQPRRPLAHDSAFLNAPANVAAISTGTRRPICTWELTVRA
jgi:hypothetical protein